MDKKIRWLLKDQMMDFAKNIETIKYYCQIFDNSHSEIMQQQEN